MKNCPFCAEKIQNNAKVCKFCRFNLETELPIDQETTTPDMSNQASQFSDDTTYADDMARAEDLLHKVDKMYADIEIRSIISQLNDDLARHFNENNLTEVADQYYKEYEILFREDFDLRSLKNIRKSLKTKANDMETIALIGRAIKDINKIYRSYNISSYPILKKIRYIFRLYLRTALTVIFNLAAIGFMLYLFYWALFS